MDGADRKACEDLLRSLGVNEIAISEVMGPDLEGRYDVYEDCLHFALSEGLLESGRLKTSHVDMILSTKFLVTYHKKEAEFIKQIRRTYRDDFIKFAKTYGFLLYEIGDHLVDRYKRTMQNFADTVEQTQLKLFGDVNDEIFHQVSELTSDILALRKICMASRELFHQLSTRKSPFIPEPTQPFLANLASALDRLAADLTTEREVLNETLNLYMGMVSHKTNKVVNRLTVLSTIFLPLSFLCGVYGMNLKNIPEMEWNYGYAYFWILCITVATVLIVFMRRRSWL